MSCFAGSGILAVILLLLNFFSMASGRGGLFLKGGPGGFGGFAAHGILGLWVGISWVGFLISLVFVIIDYAKS